MKTLPRLLVLFVLVLALAPDNVPANCQASIMPIYQCGYVGWFAPPPSGSGAVNTIWWQLGYGNNLVNTPCLSAAPGKEGTGMCGAGVFVGNDSGTAGAVMTDADSVLPQYASQIPDGSFCSNFENSWAAYNVNGCADNLRTTSTVDEDHLLNPYWSQMYGACPYDDCVYETTSYLVDYPMAMLARESNNRWFALAFIASRSRHGDSTDISEGMFDLSQVTNGDLNPVTGKLDVIPWQQVPFLLGSPSFHPDPNMWNVSLRWNPVRLVHDGSSRPTGPRPAAPPPSGGVGVLEQLDAPGGLCRYQLQVASMLSGSPSNPSTLSWSNLGSAIPCTLAPGPVQANVVVPKDSALRVRTMLGKRPRTSDPFLQSCRTGGCGDLGFEATACRADNCVESPPLLLIGGPLVSEQAVDTVAARNKNAIVVSFRTTSELTVNGIDILGKGDQVVAGVPCKQCTSGIGDRYEVFLAPGQLKGSRELRVRLNGPGTVSDPFPIE